MANFAAFHMVPYLKLLRDTLGWKIPVLLGLLLGRALIQGMGLAMLIPLLDIIGGGNRHTAPISATFMKFMNYLGLTVTLPSVLGFFLVIMIFNAALKIEFQIYDQRVQHSLVEKLKRDFLELMTHCQWTYYQQLRQSDLLHTLNGEISQINRGFYLVVSICSDLIVTGIHIFLAACISWPITLATVTCSTLLVFGLRHRIRLSEKIGKKRFTSGRRFFSVTKEHIQNMKLVKSFGLENKHLNHFTRVIREMMHYQLAHHKNELRTRFFYEVGGQIAIIAIVFVAVTYFQLAPSELILFILISSRLFPRFQKLQSRLQQFMQILPAHRSFVKQSAYLKQYQAKAIHPIDTLPFRDAIYFKNLDFQYPGKIKKRVLTDIHFKIPRQWATAIIGPSGAGKSTLIDMLTGLHFPSRGHILIDNRILDRNSLPLWRQRLAYVTQDIFLFNDTLRNNLTWMVDHADDALIWQALKDADADSVVAHLPRGLDTPLGDQGVVLSGGEKQRIVLARALIRQPEVLILDEATSDLDSQSDAFIQQTLQRLRGKMTIVVISHRLESLRLMDQIIVMKKGRIVESGNWEILKETAGSYISEYINAHSLNQRKTG